MRHSGSSHGPTCPSCHFPTRIVDRWCDYSTTRGPLTSYEVTYCDNCRLSSLNRRSAQKDASLRSTQVDRATA